MESAQVIILWKGRDGWSAAFLRETSDGRLVEVFTVTRHDRVKLDEGLRTLWPGVPVVLIPHNSDRSVAPLG